MHKLGTADHLIYEQRTPCPTRELRIKRWTAVSAPIRSAPNVHEQTVTGHNVRYVLVATAIGVEDGDFGRDIVRPLATLSQGPNARRRRGLSK